MTTVLETHIELDEQGRPWVAGANTKVIEIVVEKLAYGSSAEEIHFQHPHLSMSQIYSALAYYHDHQQEMDAEIAAQRERVNKLAEEAKDSPGRNRLRSLGLL